MQLYGLWCCRYCVTNVLTPSFAFYPSQVVCWILKHYLLIPGDDISSDLDLSGCNINTDNEEEDESYTKLIDMISDIQFHHKLQYEQRKRIDINGVGRLYPFKISVSPKNKSTLFQQDPTWTWCGPYTVVKVSLFRQFFDYILMRAFSHSI